MKNIKISKNTKFTLVIFGGFILALVLIPVIINTAVTPDYSESSAIGELDVVGKDFYENGATSGMIWDDTTESFYITVHRNETDEFQLIEFERYIVGVVAAEMPALFARGALQAQAIAARTYAMRIFQHQDYILDTVMHQVYLDNYQLQDRWGDEFELHLATIMEAVNSTRGLVLMYDGELITPLFFAMSNGATENSEDVFVADRPYLRSVLSPGYENLVNFTYEESFSVGELRYIFGDSTITTENVEVFEHSQGGNVTEVRIGERLFAGREVREMLGLRSAAFTISIDADSRIIFTTQGHGHGVGMSQHGANIMAQNGYSFEEILRHFYQNVTIERKN